MSSFLERTARLLFAIAVLTTGVAAQTTEVLAPSTDVTTSRLLHPYPFDLDAFHELGAGPSLVRGEASLHNFVVSLEIEGVVEYAPELDLESRRRFQDHRRVLDTLLLHGNAASLQLFAGKFTPAFGRAWDQAGGPFPSFVVEEYELAERWGLGGTMPLGEHHSVTLSTFARAHETRADPTLFDRRAVEQGGPGDTDGLSSYAVTWLSTAEVGGGSFEFEVSGQHQGRDASSPHHENGVAASIAYSFTTDRQFELRPFMEYASLRHLEGQPEDVEYWTAALSVGRSSWELSAQAFHRSSTVQGTRSLQQLTLVRALSSQAEIGLRFAQDSDLPPALDLIFSSTLRF